MSYLNANIPPIYCKVRKEYLYDFKEHHGESEECVVFGIASLSGKALLFHIMLPNGAVFYRLPISAFFQKRFSRSEVPDMSVDELQLWNCFSYYPSVHCFDWLSGISGKFLGKDKKFYKGQYLFTVDWAHPETNILKMLNILKYLKSISVHIYWLLLTAIMQLSLIIVFCGTLIVILLMTIGLTIKCKIQFGIAKVRIGLRKILTKCFMK
jgi:hypothetical protein